MKPWQRTLPGIAFVVILAAVLIGLVACLPVPIGNPERSRLDSDLTGIWTEVDGEPFVTLFEPYDKRTWLVSMIAASPGAGCAPPMIPPGYDKLVAWLEEEPCAGADRASIYKTWRSKQGKRWFLTMQPMALINDEADDPFSKGAWFVYRIDKISADTFELRLVDPEFEGFKGLAKKRRDFEKVIRKHAEDDDMYVEPTSRFERVRDEHIGLFADFIDDVIDVEL